MSKNKFFEPRLKFKFKPYAMIDKKSLGRLEEEKLLIKEDFRTQFQHDRDRIIHAKAFRRLESKTQVALSHEGDHLRKRLTHSLEVAQISESIAITLGVNTFLTSAIALGHDIGHAPFGHGGEEALDIILEDLKMEGFKHNYQSLLVVNKLEKRDIGENALNLMWETRDGILKHTGLRQGISLKYYDPQLKDHPEFPVTLEGQIVNVVDEIAQRTHDTDDGLRTDRIDIRELTRKDLVKDVFKYNNINKNELIKDFKTNREAITSRIVKAMIKYYVFKLINNTLLNLKIHNIKTYNDVAKQNNKLACFNTEFTKKDKRFRDTFLRDKFYNHHEIKRMDSRATYFIVQIFKAFKKNPKQLPQNVHHDFHTSAKQFLKNERKSAKNEYLTDLDNFLNKEPILCKNTCPYIPDSKIFSENQKYLDLCPLRKHNKRACEGMRVIVNHIAGMTDRYAHLEYSRLYFPPEISRM